VAWHADMQVFFRPLMVGSFVWAAFAPGDEPLPRAGNIGDARFLAR